MIDMVCRFYPLCDRCTDICSVSHGCELYVPMPDVGSLRDIARTLETSADRIGANAGSNLTRSIAMSQHKVASMIRQAIGDEPRQKGEPK